MLLYFELASNPATYFLLSHDPQMLPLPTGPHLTTT